MTALPIRKQPAAAAGQCLRCGAGERGPVSVYVFAIGTFQARLCLNCLKVLRLAIEDVLLLPDHKEAT